MDVDSFEACGIETGCCTNTLIGRDGNKVETISRATSSYLDTPCDEPILGIATAPLLFMIA
jgi:hypothetical protein